MSTFVHICSILHRFHPSHPSDISASHVHVTDLAQTHSHKKKKKKLHQKQQQQSKKEQQRILHLYKWRWISWRFRVTHKCHTVTKHTQNHMTIDYTGCTRGSPEAQQVSTAPTATPIPKRLIECLYRSSCATTYPSSWNASRGLKSYSRTEPDSCLA